MLTKKDKAAEQNAKKVFAKTTMHFSVPRLIFLAIFIILIMVGLKALGIIGKKEVKVTVLTSSQIQDVLQTSELSTYKATYNGVAKCYKKNSSKDVAYCVSYKGIIKVGIDMKDLDVEVIHAEKEGEKSKIVITIPLLRPTEFNVDISSLDYMFMSDKYDTPTVSETAYKLCQADLVEAGSQNDAIYVLGEQNCEKLIKALLEPIISSQSEMYELVFNYEGRDY